MQPAVTARRAEAATVDLPVAECLPVAADTADLRVAADTADRLAADLLAVADSADLRPVVMADRLPADTGDLPAVEWAAEWAEVTAAEWAEDSVLRAEDFRLRAARWGPAPVKTSTRRCLSS